jgi:hypothetical protein
MLYVLFQRDLTSVHRFRLIFDFFRSVSTYNVIIVDRLIIETKPQHFHTTSKIISCSQKISLACRHFLMSSEQDVLVPKEIFQFQCLWYIYKRVTRDLSDRQLFRNTD